ncbi:hypothetical protein KFV08_07725 [Macrococcoides canis]|uniref:hypothetical protein n=1 Tax=Macrococcoides canis TaxID=1855823 RepID=UPI00207C7310|nr:hypothetical protein [Macrococcus canis]MCO4095705.1 hypothetical protein [Macrococcus canis]UTH08414.1 hypothetical protein KFV08_07725 [Macrococcus canis]
MADTKDSYTLEALLIGNNSRLKKVIDQAVAMLERLENRNAEDVKIDGDVKPLQKKVETAKRLSETINNLKSDVEITADTDNLNRKVKQAQMATELLDGKKAQIEIVTKNAEAIAKMRQVRLSAKALSSERPKIDVDMDTAAATSKAQRLKAMLRSIPNKIRTRINIDVDTNKISLLKSSLLSLAPSAIPILATLIPAIMAIGNALAVVGGGAIGLAGAFGVAGTGVMAFGAMAIRAYQMLQDGTIQATAETQAFQTALESLKSQFDSLVSTNASAIFNTMTNGINIAKAALSGLTPFITGVANSLEQLSTKVLSWTQSSTVAQNFFNMMKTTGVSVFENILVAAGRFGSGLISLFTQFGPLFSWVAQGLANMGNQFDAWSQKVSTAQGIQSFINYTKTNLPLIGQIFSNTFNAIFNLFKAFGSNSQSIFQALAQMSAKFEQWSSTVSQSQGFRQFIEYVQTQGPIVMSTLGNIANALIQFAVAMAPIGAAVLGVVNAVAQWISGFMQAHPVITQIVGALVLFGGIVIKVVSFIMRLWSAVQFVIGIFGGWSSVMSAVSLAIGFLTTPIGIAIAAIVAIGAAIYLLWTKCEVFRNGVMILIGIMQTLGSVIMTALVSAFQTVITWIGQVIAGIVSFGAQLLSAMQTAWNMVTTVVATALGLLVNHISSSFSNMLSIGSSIMSSLLSTASSIFSSIVSAISSAISSAVSFVSSGFSNMLSVASSIMSSISSAVSSAFSMIVSFISSGISSALSFVSSGFSSMMSAASSFASSLISTITSAMSSFVSAISSGASQAISAVSSMISSILSAITGAAGQMVSAGADLVRGFISGIKSMAGAAVSAAADMASAAVSKVKSMLRIHSPSRVFKAIGGYTAQGMAIGILKGIPKVYNATKAMAGASLKAVGRMKTNSVEKSRKAFTYFYDTLSNTSAKASEKLYSNNKRIAEIQRKLRTKLSKNTRASLNAQLMNLRKENKVYSAQKSVVDKLKTVTKRSSIQLLGIAKKREAIANRLKVAQEQLKEVYKERTSFKSDILQNTRSFGSIANSKVSTTQGLIADMKARAKAIAQFSANINKLKSRGVNQNTIQQLLSTGIEGGGEQARILANASKDTIKQINTLQKQIGNVTHNLAERQASDFFSVGVNAARGLVEGLKKHDKALVAAANRIANTITNTVKRNLGIHSPSRVFAWLGNNTILGYIKGVAGNESSVVKTMSNLAQRASNAFNPQFASSVPDLTSSLRNATSNIASQVNADVVNTVRNEPVGMTLNANLALGNRDYNAFVGDITDKQNTNVRLEEVYDI